MICKNCGKELEDDEIVCTQCGEDNSPEAAEEEKSRINPWKIAFPTVVSLTLLLVLSWLLYFGVTGSFLPKKNDIYYKTSYTATEDELYAARNTVVAVMGEHKLTNAQLQVFYTRQLIDFSSQYDSKIALDAQLYDEKTGLTWQQYLMQMALNTWKQYQTVMDRAKADGFELPEEYQKNLDNLEAEMQKTAEKNGYSSAEEMVSDDIAKGCTVADYGYFLERYYWSTLYTYELSEKAEISEEDLEAYFVEHQKEMAEGGITKDSGYLVDMRNILLTPETEDEVISDAYWNACESDAKALMDLWLKSDATEDSFADIAVKYSKDSKSAANGGLYQYVRSTAFDTVDIRHILIMPAGGTKDENGKTVYSDAEWDACRKKAQDILDEYLAGERTEERFAELAKKNSMDGNSASGGIYTDVNKNDMVEEFDSWIFDDSRKNGDTDLVKTQFGYHVMFFISRDNELNLWLFDEDRKAGDYATVKTDEGYQLVYYVFGEEGWRRYCRIGAAGDKVSQLLKEMTEGVEIETTYRRIRLVE